ncbi:hypothetical protein T492DRAFT_848750 [Pavlovales sp. CCMP2436]|nr:hypothetical protein T492DRAFT_848750 [Pavlovales sp. CCMP2436]
MANVFGQLQHKTKPLEVPLTINTTTITHLSLSSLDEEQNKTRDPAKVLLRTVVPEILTIKLIKNIPGSSYTRDFVWSTEDSPSSIVTKWKAQMRPTISSFSAVYDQDLDFGSITDVLYQVDRDFGTDQAKRSLGTKLVLPFNSSIFETPLTYVSELKLTTDLETASSNSIGLQFTLAQESTFTEGTVALIGDTLKLQSETLTDPLSSTYTMKLRNLPLPDPLPVLGVLVIVKWNDQMRLFVDGNSFGHLTLTYDTTTSKFAPVFDYSTDYGTPEGFGWFSMWDGDDTSKDHIGLERTPSYLNPGWSAGPRPLSMSTWPLIFPYAAGFYFRTVKLDVFITGSNDYRTSRKRKLTMIIKHSNDVTFFSDATEVLRDTEAGPACLWWFICNRIVHRRNYTDNGTTMNVVNSIERIEDALYTVQEKINIVSCTATSDSWLITTDNPSGDVQLNVVPAYSTEDIEVFIKNSPLFVNNINISTSNDWNNSDGWRIVSSSTYQNNASYAANAAFDKNADFFVTIRREYSLPWGNRTHGMDLVGL